MVGIDFVGYLAGIIIATSLTPQIIKSYKTKSTRDISITWTIIYMIGLLLWVIYGFGINSFPVIITTIIEVILAGLLLNAKIRYG